MGTDHYEVSSYAFGKGYTSTGLASAALAVSTPHQTPQHKAAPRHVQHLALSAVNFKLDCQQQQPACGVMLTGCLGGLQVDWESMWRERLADYARPQEVKSALGWSTKAFGTLEVCDDMAAAQGGW